MLPIQFVKHKEGRTGSRLLDLTYNVSHASLVAKEGSEVAWLLGVIPGEGLHCNRRDIHIRLSSYGKVKSKISTRSIKHSKIITAGSQFTIK